MVVIVWQLDLQLPVQLVPITTKLVSSNPVHGKVYSIQHYVIKFVSDLRQASGFLRVLPVSSTNKTDCHDITEILLKVTLNTINPNSSTKLFILVTYTYNFSICFLSTLSSAPPASLDWISFLSLKGRCWTNICK